SYARHADAYIEGRALAGVEEVRLQVDLAVGDRDHVRRDEGRDVVRLCLDHWQRGEGAAAVRLVQLRRSLQQPRVKVEHVAWVRLATGRPAQSGRELAVGPGLLGQVVVAAKSFLALVHEVLAHGAARVGCDVLQGGRVGRRSRDDDRVVHG